MRHLDIPSGDISRTGGYPMRQDKPSRTLRHLDPPRYPGGAWMAQTPGHLDGALDVSTTGQLIGETG